MARYEEELVKLMKEHARQSAFDELPEMTIAAREQRRTAPTEGTLVASEGASVEPLPKPRPAKDSGQMVADSPIAVSGEELTDHQKKLIEEMRTTPAKEKPGSMDFEGAVIEAKAPAGDPPGALVRVHTTKDGVEVLEKGQWKPIEQVTDTLNYMDTHPEHASQFDKAILERARLRKTSHGSGKEGFIYGDKP